MDWPKIIARLREHYTLQEIADRCDMSKGGVHDLGSGHAKSVIYERGVKLVDMHRRLRRRK
jgi:predicted DNA-binding protein YlxM (UPF0122 family)